MNKFNLLLTALVVGLLSLTLQDCSCGDDDEKEIKDSGVKDAADDDDDNDDDDNNDDDTDKTSFTISPEGGEYEDPIRGITIKVGAGSVKEETEITIEDAPPGRAGDGTFYMVGKMYRIGPEGLKFDKPIGLTLPYLQALVSQYSSEGLSDSDIKLYTSPSNKIEWSYFEDSAVDVLNATVATLSVTHFSDFVAGIPKKGPPPKPTCRITKPDPRGSIEFSDDTDTAIAGLQIDFEITCEEVEEGTEARIIINGNYAGTKQVVSNSKVVFEKITVADSGNGMFTAKGEISANGDSFNTEEAAYKFPVCAAQISSPPNGSILGMKLDADSEAVGLQVNIEVSSEGCPQGSAIKLVKDAKDYVGEIDAERKAVVMVNFGSGDGIQAMFGGNVSHPSGAAAEIAQAVYTVDTVAPNLAVSYPADKTKLTCSQSETPFVGGVIVTIKGSAAGAAGKGAISLIIDQGEESEQTIPEASEFEEISYTFAGVELMDGLRTLTVIALDAAGNEAVKKLSVEIDSSICPTIEITNLTEGQCLNQAADESEAEGMQFTLNVLGDNLIEGATFDVFLDDGKINATGVPISSKKPVAYSAELGGDGIKTISTSLNGNYTIQGESVNILIDTLPPTIAFDTRPTLINTLTRSFTVSFAGNDGRNLELFVNSAATPIVAAAPTSSHIFSDVQLTEGQNTLRVCTADACGNPACDQMAVTVDSTPPIVTLEITGLESSVTCLALPDTPEDATAITKEFKVTANGVALGSAIELHKNGVKLLESPCVDLGDNKRGAIFSGINLEAGDLVFKGKATDAAGNVGESAGRALFVDLSRPTVSWVSNTPAGNDITFLMGQPSEIDIVLQLADTSGVIANQPCTVVLSGGEITVNTDASGRAEFDNYGVSALPDPGANNAFTYYCKNIAKAECAGVLSKTATGSRNIKATKPDADSTPPVVVIKGKKDSATIVTLANDDTISINEPAVDEDAVMEGVQYKINIEGLDADSLIRSGTNTARLKITDTTDAEEVVVLDKALNVTADAGQPNKGYANYTIGVDPDERAWFTYGRTFKIEAMMADANINEGTKTLTNIKTVDPGRHHANIEIDSTYKVFRSALAQQIPFKITCEKTDPDTGLRGDPAIPAEANSTIKMQELDKDNTVLNTHEFQTDGVQTVYAFNYTPTVGTRYFKAKCFEITENDATDSGYTPSVRASYIDTEPAQPVFVSPSGNVTNWNRNRIDFYHTLTGSESDRLQHILCTTADIGKAQGLYCDAGHQQIMTAIANKTPPNIYIPNVQLVEGTQTIYAYAIVPDDNPANKVRSTKDIQITADLTPPAVTSMVLNITTPDTTNDNAPLKGTEGLWGMNKAEADSGYSLTVTLDDGTRTNLLQNRTVTLYINDAWAAQGNVPGTNGVITFNNFNLNEGLNHTFRVEVQDPAGNFLRRTDAQPGLKGPPAEEEDDSGIKVDRTPPTINLISSIENAAEGRDGNRWWNATHLDEGSAPGMYKFKNGWGFLADADAAKNSRLRFYLSDGGTCTDGDSVLLSAYKQNDGPEICPINSAEANIGPDRTAANPTQQYCAEIIEPLGNTKVSAVSIGRLIGKKPSAEVAQPVGRIDPPYDADNDDDPGSPGVQLTTSFMEVKGCKEFECYLATLTNGNIILKSLEEQTGVEGANVNFGLVNYIVHGVQTIRAFIQDVAGNEFTSEDVASQTVAIDLQGAPALQTFYTKDSTDTELFISGCGANCNFGESRDKNPADGVMTVDLKVKTDIPDPASLRIVIAGGEDRTVPAPAMTACGEGYCYTFADFNLGGDGYDKTLNVTVQNDAGTKETTYPYKISVRQKSPCFTKLLRPFGEQAATGDCDNAQIADPLYFTREDTTRTDNYLKLAGGQTLQLEATNATGVNAVLSVFAGGTGGGDILQGGSASCAGGPPCVADFTDLVLKHQPAGAEMTLRATLDDKVNPPARLDFVTRIDVVAPSAIADLTACAGPTASAHCGQICQDPLVCSRRSGTTAAYFNSVADDGAQASTGKVSAYQMRAVRKSKITTGAKDCSELTSDDFETFDTTDPGFSPVKTYSTGIKDPGEEQTLQVSADFNMLTGVTYCVATRGKDEKAGWPKHNAGKTEGSANPTTSAWKEFSLEWKTHEKQITGTDMKIGSSAAGGPNVDINGDGYPDWVLGAPWYLDGTRKGKAIVYFGNPDPENITSVELQPNQLDERFGSAIAVEKIIGNDDKYDVIVGAYNANSGEGQLYIYDGSTIGGTLNTRIITGPAGGQFFGRSLSSGGKSIDAKDTKSDIVIGQTRFPSSADARGRIWFIPNDSPFFAGVQATPKGIDSTDVVPNADRWTFTGNEGSGQVGLTVSSGGDVDNDGKGDVLTSAPLFNTNVGKAYLIRGIISQALEKPTDITPTTTGVITIPNPLNTNTDRFFGYSVSFIGDINNDGYDDFAISTWGDASTPPKIIIYQGRAAEHWNASDTLATTRGILGYSAVLAVSQYNNKETKISAAGDLNNDGYDDILIGIDNGGGTDKPQEVVIIYGTGETDMIDGYPILSQNHLANRMARIVLNNGLANSSFDVPHPISIGNLFSDGSSFDTSFSDWVVGDINNKMIIFY